MNEQEKHDLIQYRFAKALETLAGIEVLFQNCLWNMAVNRLYYACYYAVTALLADIDVFTKTHTGARQMLGLHFVKEGKLSSRASSFYSEIFDKRQKGDYEDFVDFEEEDAIRLLEPAKEFIKEIGDILYEDNANIN